jgi:tRNA pseudouridine38-40 synthase
MGGEEGFSAASLPCNVKAAATPLNDESVAGGDQECASQPLLREMQRLALGISYRGQRYQGWQSQLSGATVQDHLEAALARFLDRPVRTVCAGRTDAGVHALQQVVHLDTTLHREPSSWVRGTNRYLPADMAVQWCQAMAPDFHARFSAIGRRYRYVLLESPVRPSWQTGLVGWSFRPLSGDAMQQAAAYLLGTHDFSAFRAAQCQARSPVKTLAAISIQRQGRYWLFDFDANAFLHHMVRNIMGCLVMVGNGTKAVDWMKDILSARARQKAAPTFPADGLYFVGPCYEPVHSIPEPDLSSLLGFV